MGISKYTRFGLRADKNLSDLTNKSQALENILDDFTPGQVFTSADLTVINGLKTTSLYANDLAPLANTEVLYTPITLDENNNYTIGVPAPVEPLVTVKDIIQTKRVVLGDPPYHIGGSGPNAFVVPPEALNVNAGAYSDASEGGTHETITADSIYDTTNASGLIVTGEDYWIDGRFAFNGPFHSTFSAPFGALSWDGYFSGHDNPVLRIITNSFLLLEVYDEETSAWVTKKRVSAQGNNAADCVYLEYNGSFTNQTTGIPLTEHAMTLAWEGFKVVESDGSVYEITSVDEDNNTIGVTKISGSGTGLSTNGGATAGSAECHWTIGDDDLLVRELRILPFKVKGQTTRVRLTAWYPKPEMFPTSASTQMANVSSFGPFKLFFDRDDGFNGDIGTPFNWWYKTNQLAPDSEPKLNTFDHFKRNKISPRKKITTEYVQNEQPVYIDYEPSLDIADYFKDANSDAYVTPTTFTWQGGNAYTTSANYIEVGDILLSKANGADNTFNGVFLQVYEIQDGGTRILTEPFKGPLDKEFVELYRDNMSVGDSFSAYVLKPKGLLGLFIVNGQASGTGGTGFTGSQSGDLTVNLYEASNALHTAGGYVGVSSTGVTGTFKDYQYNVNDIRQNDLVIIMEGSGDTQTLTNTRATDTTKVRRISSVPTITAPAAGTYFPAGDGSSLQGAVEVQFNCKHTGTHEAFTEAAWGWVAIYSHRGLSDHSISAQCVGVYGKEVTATLVGGSGANTVTLTDTNEITDGDYIQFDGLGGPSDQVIPQGTTVTVQNATQIQLSNDIPTGKSLNAASTVVFIKAANYTAEVEAGSGDNNKEICVIPLNTAPPFAGTDLGLSTVSTHPHLSVGGDFEITGINIEQASTTEVGSPTSATANKGLLLKEKTGASTYKDYWILMD